MLTGAELDDMRRTLAGTSVLSVYLDTKGHNPATRDAWRTSFTSALRTARNSLDAVEQRVFDLAASELIGQLFGATRLAAAPAWAAFATADGVQHFTALPVRSGTIVEWREGPVVTPYLRALEAPKPCVRGTGCVVHP